MLSQDMTDQMVTEPTPDFNLTFSGSMVYTALCDPTVY